MNKKNILMIALIAVLAIVIIVAAVLFITVMSQNIHLQQEENARMEAYRAAETLLEEAKYDEAITAFANLGTYKDCPLRVKEAMAAKEEAARLVVYEKAIAAIEAGSLREAKALLEQLETDYKDVQDRLSRFEYAITGIAMKYVGFNLDASRVSYTFNPDGTIATTEYYYTEGNAETAIQDTLVHTYENGLLTSRASDLQSFTYTYDDKGNLTQVKYEKKADTLGEGYEDFSFDYMLGELTWSNGDSITYTYDANGNRATGDFQITSGYQGTYKETYTVDADGKVTALERAYSGITEVYEYTYENGLLTAVQMTTQNGEAPAEAHGFTYTYDEQGRLLSIVSNLGLGVEYSFNYDWIYHG